MAEIEGFEWYKAKEIPLNENDWRSIKLYCQDAPLDSTRCVYFMRLGPPYSVVYGEDCQLESPLVYVGSGSIKQRWSDHRAWLNELGAMIPTGRYEVWICQPRLRRTADFYKDIEADILNEFKRRCGYLPLYNRKTQKHPRAHTYGKAFFDTIFRTDRRYKWAIYPLEDSPLSERYYKGART